MSKRKMSEEVEDALMAEERRVEFLLEAFHRNVMVDGAHIKGYTKEAFPEGMLYKFMFTNGSKEERVTRWPING